MSDYTPEQLYRLHTSGGGKLSWAQVGAQVDMSGAAARGRVRRWKAKDAQYSHYDDKGYVYKTPVTETALESRVKHIEEMIEKLSRQREQEGGEADDSPFDGAGNGMYAPTPEHLNDTPLWEAWKIKQSGKTICMLAMFDLHIPDHNPQVWALSCQIAAYVRPDVILFGGDLFDFDALSSFLTPMRRVRNDALNEIAAPWSVMVSQLQQAYRSAIFVAFPGNHEARLDRWNANNGNPMFEVTEERMVDVARAGGLVWWLGRQQETLIGELFAHHGQKARKYEAANIAENKGYARSIIGGHTHKPGVFYKRVGDVVITSAVSGALCNIPPHYQQHSQQSDWIPGILLCHVPMDGSEPDIQQVIYHRRSNALWACVGTHQFTEIDVKCHA